MPLLDGAHRAEQFRKLTEVSRALTYATSLDEVLRLAVDRAAELLDGEQAVLMLQDEHGLLHVRAAHGVGSEAVERFREPLDESLTKRLQGLFGYGREECFLGVPLVAKGEVTGMLAVMRASGAACSEAEEWLLSALADQAAVAIENARLTGEVHREMKERLRATEAATESKERALSTLAHDLRSPLNAIDSYAELMEMEILGPVTDRQREALGRVRMSGRHLLAVLESVLEMARLSAGVVRLQPDRVRADSVVGEAAQIVLPAATAKEQELVVEPAPEMWLRTDPGRLRQVLVNLIGNAVKYTPAGGTLRVSTALVCSDGRAWCAISVADTGPGIAPELREVIFEPYYRVEDAAESGSGLGLAISRELVRQMGGEIGVASEPGGGATFTVRLPLPAEEGTRDV
ncbi:MAG TPA: HAMP domain-containing sensor histidine kinase [Longimicrobiaceae bacterium]|nr:HAMP domain-containing sensor histidine kinase [Longimicrobiaceae bacterium]